MRLFTAIELSDDIKHYIDELQSNTHQLSQMKRKQKTANMHLTLHFLGEVEGEKLTEIHDKIRGITNHQQPFQLSLNGWGAFPNENRPRVVWIGIDGDLAQLNELQAQLGKKLTRYGYKEEGMYSPHITLGREPKGKIDWDHLREHHAIEPLLWKVDQIVLFESQFQPGGVHYYVIERYKFR